MESIQSDLLSPPPKEDRQSANFHPSVWDDFFISKPPLPDINMASLKSKNEELKVDVRKMLIDTTDQLHSLELIDRIQCLGVAYHFEKEIEEKLLKIYETSAGYDDLYTVALHFRLLRQQRYHISCDVFSKFLDEKGEFMSYLNNDVKALLSLYEAAHLSMPSEEILDKALEFSKIQLKTLASNMDPYLLEMVSSSLEIPLVRRVDRLKAKLYLSIFEKESICNETLLNFAKLDFNLLQATHQEEARSLSIWWKDLNLTKSLPFTRDRLIEGYFWVLSVYVEPHYSRARLMMTKVISLLSILDDIYDVYGTVEELQLLTDVIESWQLENVGKLPQYMQHEFLALYRNFKEFENKLEQEQYSFRVHYLKEEKKKMAKAFIQEAVWADDGYIPKLKEYLEVSLISSGYGYLACASYIGMQDEISKEFFDWLTSMPQIIKSSNFIARVVNDISTNEFEQKRKHVASAVQCYVMEYGCSNEEACKKLMEMVEEEWKILNREFIFSKKNIPIPLLRTIINLTNVLELAYKDAQDIYTESTKIMKENIIDVLVEPVQIHMDVRVACPSSV
ncbi:alpha-humulene synthase-like [Dendrobium catenatum]|uniref:Beta-cubebene synthase n=1 Tax=Dendrobium catenatum TaxID=906689 RepID=A0A2I0XBW4_9ASPA|nr:alpha-humulene synthase-like [Dendrobium catenatum]PKU85402.1 Beta-cubebene synthase [Dendrobium catenatum]